jgi:aerobic carbon-monoxide dehydrogenase small subunit
MNINLKVNGKSQSADVEPRLLLSDFIRDNLGLTGTKTACDTGQCGACTILVNGVAVKSCMLLAVQADGAEILTIEGVGTADKLHPIQQALWEKHGIQCGYCTPAIVLAVMDLLQQKPQPTDAEIRTCLDGILCRCTGYQNIVEAVKYAVQIS